LNTTWYKAETPAEHWWGRNGMKKKWFLWGGRVIDCMEYKLLSIGKREVHIILRKDLY